MRRFLPCVLLLVAACTSSDLTLGWQQDRIPHPHGVPSATPTATAVPLDFGDGHDGAFTAAPGTMVLNTCLSLSSGTGSTLGLAGTPGFQAGRRVLVLQVKDAFVSGDPGDAGRWELARVTAFDGVNATLQAPLLSSYGTNGAGRVAQVCSVPEFTDATIPAGATLVASPWNGSTGGVLAIFASGVLDVTGALSARGVGFRGGAPNPGGNDASDVTAENTSADNGGFKGEGADGSAPATPYGRGNRANGGGGGNARSAGGGGGGGGAAGGLGGMQDSGSGTLAATAGRGGVGMGSPFSARVHFGGGGGGAHEHKNTGTTGGTGGGFVLTGADIFSGAGVLDASGLAAGTSGIVSDGDGSGGGGGGGSILVTCSSCDFAGDIFATGGAGGNVNNDNADGEYYGPGGGGGGGRVSVPAALSGAVFDLAGGVHGSNSVAIGALGSTAWGAADGAPSVLETLVP